MFVIYPPFLFSSFLTQSFISVRMKIPQRGEGVMLPGPNGLVKIWIPPMVRSGLHVTSESFESLTECWRHGRCLLRWDCLFMLPPWLETWWREFGSGEELYFVVIREGEDILGVAPLFLKGAKAHFIGSPDLCDYSDFIVRPGRESDFFNSLLDELKERGTKDLDLKPLRPDSTTLIHLPGVARGRGWRCSCEPEDTSLELYLPSTWEAYLEMLNQKQRHEVRRKLRRIGEIGKPQFRVLEYPEAFADGMAIFLKMFRESREDKAAFMSPQRESFFCSIVEAMARVNLIRLGILELSGTPIAAILFFDYNNVVYLYNSGYDLQYRSLSAGLVSKILCIKDSIERNKSKFDFLKGDEIYKYRLGGKPIPLYRCNVYIE